MLKWWILFVIFWVFVAVGIYHRVSDSRLSFCLLTLVLMIGLAYISLFF